MFGRSPFPNGWELWVAPYIFFVELFTLFRSVQVRRRECKADKIAPRSNLHPNACGRALYGFHNEGYTHLRGARAGRNPVVEALRAARTAPQPYRGPLRPLRVTSSDRTNQSPLQTQCPQRQVCTSCTLFTNACCRCPAMSAGISRLVPMMLAPQNPVLPQRSSAR